MTKAQAQVMKQWAKALRSGDYKQARGQLKKGVGYCCLGVLCDIVDRKGHGKDWFNGDMYPPDNVKHRAGLNVVFGVNDVDELADLNDHHKATFEEIADVVDWIRMSDAKA